MNAATHAAHSAPAPFPALRMGYSAPRDDESRRAHEASELETRRRELEQEIDADIAEATAALANTTDSAERQELETRLTSLQGSRASVSAATSLRELGSAAAIYRNERSAKQTDAVVAGAKDATANMTASEKVDYYAGQYEQTVKAIAGEGGQMDQRRSYGERTASRLDEIGRESGFNTKPFNDLRQHYQSEAEAKRKKGDIDGALGAEAGAFAVQGEQIRQMLEAEKDPAKRQELQRLERENARKLQEIEENRREHARAQAKKEAAKNGLTGEAAERAVKAAEEEASRRHREDVEKATRKSGEIGLDKTRAHTAQQITAQHWTVQEKIASKHATVSELDDDEPSNASPKSLTGITFTMKAAGVVHSSTEATPEKPDGQLKPTQVAEAKTPTEGKTQPIRS